jgi:hypothetical protein
VTQIREQRTIAASPVHVFAWLLDPANLTVSLWFRKATWADASGPGVGGKVLEILSAPLMRSFAFRAILAGCAKALES